ncbi:MAG: class I SAM-dependent methyltransferase [Planctomycetota bacterium]
MHLSVRTTRRSRRSASLPTAEPRLGLLRAFVTWMRRGRTEQRLDASTGSFRATDPQTVAAAYGAMSEDEFRVVNAMQAWFNQRAIPGVLRTLPRHRPWRIVDLGCGTGGSSAILLRCAPPASELLGYDLCDRNIARARLGTYRDAGGRAARAHFVCQSILDPLCTAGGDPLPPASVDLAHAAGVVGHHVCRRGLRTLAEELRRILAPDGIAVLDPGPRMPARDLVATMTEYGFGAEPCAWWASLVARFPRRFRRLSS